MDSTGALYYATGVFGNGWQVPSGAQWSKSSFTLAGVSGSGSTTSASSSSSASGTASASLAPGAVTASSSSSGTAKTSSGTGTATGAPATTSTASGALGFVGVNGGLVGLAVGCLGMALLF
jgi:hypothetical protein